MRRAAVTMAPVLIALIGMDLAFLDLKPSIRYLFAVELGFMTASYAWFLLASWRYRQAQRQFDEALDRLFAQCVPPLDEDIKEHIRKHADRELLALVCMFALPDEFFTDEQTDRRDGTNHARNRTHG